MNFACIYVPNFMVQAIVRGEPALRCRPLAIVEGASSLGIVIAANEKARRAGVQLGMAKSQAEQLGPVELRFRSPAQEEGTHAALLDLGWSVSPRLENVATDTVVLDLSGLGRFGDPETIANRLEQRIRGFGLSVHVAVASKLDAAVTAARGFSGITIIPPGKEAERLSGLPIRVLSPSAEILGTLERWGIRTLKALAALPTAQLSERLGQEGVRLQELARGGSPRQFVPIEPAAHFEERMELEYSVGELEPLSFILGRLLDQLCARLSARSLSASKVHLTLELEPSSEGASLGVADGSKRSLAVYQRMLCLPVPVRDSKTLLRLWRLKLQSDPPPAPILKIRIVAEPARPRVAQGGLFIPLLPDPEKLEVIMARLVQLVGDGNVGSAALVDTHRPGAFCMKHFRPIDRGSERRRGKRSGARPKEQKREHFHSMAFRIYRSPLRATVETRAGVPARICFCGVRGDVVRASGPWRTLGDWWREESWAEDEWDIELHCFSDPVSVANGVPEETKRKGRRMGLYRVYCELATGHWFVRGTYD